MSLAPARPPDFELMNTMKGASGSSGARNFFVLARYGVGILRQAPQPLTFHYCWVNLLLACRWILSCEQHNGTELTSRETALSMLAADYVRHASMITMLRCYCNGYWAYFHANTFYADGYMGQCQRLIWNGRPHL